jgi:dienelactone hydrolase
MGRLNFEAAVVDATAALAHLKQLPEVLAAGGRAGVMGFCLGGRISFRVAAAADPDCAVSYCGSAVPGSLAVAGDITCPILFHFGLEDQYLTVDKQQAVKAAFAGNPAAELHDHAAPAMPSTTTSRRCSPTRGPPPKRGSRPRPSSASASRCSRSGLEWRDWAAGPSTRARRGCRTLTV